MTRIFSIHIGESGYRVDEVQRKIDSFANTVETFMQEQPKASVTWLQSSASYGYSGGHDMFTRITAIVRS